MLDVTFRPLPYVSEAPLIFPEEETREPEVGLFLGKLLLKFKALSALFTPTFLTDLTRNTLGLFGRSPELSILPESAKYLAENVFPGDLLKSLAPWENSVIANAALLHNEQFSRNFEMIKDRLNRETAANLEALLPCGPFDIDYDTLRSAVATSRDAEIFFDLPDQLPSLLGTAASFPRQLSSLCMINPMLMGLFRHFNNPEAAPFLQTLSRLLSGGSLPKMMDLLNVPSRLQNLVRTPIELQLALANSFLAFLDAAFPSTSSALNQLVRGTFDLWPIIEHIFNFITGMPDGNGGTGATMGPRSSGQGMGSTLSRLACPFASRLDNMTRSSTASPTHRSGSLMTGGLGGLAGSLLQPLTGGSTQSRGNSNGLLSNILSPLSDLTAAPSTTTSTTTNTARVTGGARAQPPFGLTGRQGAVGSEVPTTTSSSSTASPATASASTLYALNGSSTTTTTQTVAAPRPSPPRPFNSSSTSRPFAKRPFTDGSPGRGLPLPLSALEPSASNPTSNFGPATSSGSTSTSSSTSTSRPASAFRPASALGAASALGPASAFNSALTSSSSRPSNSPTNAQSSPVDPTKIVRIYVVSSHNSTEAAQMLPRGPLSQGGSLLNGNTRDNSNVFVVQSDGSSTGGNEGLPALLFLHNADGSNENAFPLASSPSPVPYAS